MTFFPEFNRNLTPDKIDYPQVRVNEAERERREKEPYSQWEENETSEEEISLVSALNLLLNKLSKIVRQHKKIAQSPFPTPLIYSLLDLKYFFNKIPSLPQEAFNELYEHLSSVWLDIDKQMRLSQKAKWKLVADYKILTDLLYSITVFSKNKSPPLGHFLSQEKISPPLPIPAELTMLFLTLKNDKSSSSTLSTWIKKIDLIT
ncbi:hypothetical protein COB21_00590 [Candidatus Aerophobetes bacterium]|uniref:Uncharacterized protein n=1 Tax=Aerophobetes bacterium TaxID=2030807 RepID=A0A2A4X8H1_UNCAE|nr:MAG: hypothetical protein COB21_00590 [Candidatus Aerophobetes bacterium]